MTAFGLVLLVLGALVAATEAHVPSHGAAGGLGVLSMAAGAVLAISGLGAGVAVGLAAGVALAAIGGGAVLLTVRKGLAVRGRGGADGLIGEIGVVRSWSDADGSVALHGSVWRARRSMLLEEADDEPGAGESPGEGSGEGSVDGENGQRLHAGDRVVVERLSGLTLCVRPAEKWELF